ncbi:hypothetical protein GN330_16035 [Nitratireductor sp. CAU 1489]|uniref:Uncharacterized protein n=1 Tax=Nitratireductor arenosus TaxID=2682096 RepID=A0A844QHU2_9HYPH|nr:hypothetical protein [Nitratireductor arenosus]MVA98757.1 hypothetical protein [Nitratireductor arenosus]
MRRLLLAGLVLLAGAASSAATQDATPVTSDHCKALLAQISAKPQFKAFAVTENGRECHAVWGSANQLQANRDARAGCEVDGRHCLLIAVR